VIDDQTDDCAFGADNVARSGPTFRNLRFQMIADIDEQTRENAYWKIAALAVYGTS
jgi:hypothetical protein